MLLRVSIAVFIGGMKGLDRKGIKGRAGCRAAVLEGVRVSSVCNPASASARVG